MLAISPKHRQDAILPENNGQAGLYPQDQLDEALLLTLSHYGNQFRLSRLRSLLSDPAFDWDSFWQLAIFHQVQTLVAKEFADPSNQLPIPLNNLQTARALRLETMLYNMSVHAELQRIGEIMQENCIRCVPLKGTYLAKQLFGTLDARRCGDIDLFVPIDQREKADGILRKSGYGSLENAKPGVKNHAFHGLPLIRRKDGIGFVVELHWHLSDPKFVTIDDQAVWDRIALSSQADQDLCPLPQEELLVFLALHWPKHSNGMLRLLVDIDRLIVSPDSELDWQYAVYLADQWRVGDLLYFTLKSCEDLLATPIPVKVMEALKPGWFKCNIRDFLINPGVIMHPPEDDHLRANRFRLAYCVLLTPVIRAVQAYRHYLLTPSAARSSHFLVTPILNARLLASGIVWTWLSFWSAYRDTRASR